MTALGAEELFAALLALVGMPLSWGQRVSRPLALAGSAMAFAGWALLFVLHLGSWVWDPPDALMVGWSLEQAWKAGHPR